jgi:uncharacterized protein DUF1587
MPPPGASRPDAATLTAIVHALETAMDARAALHPKPGWRPFQRLNRAEYAAAVRDLLGIEIDVTAYLPPDTMSGGFDNVADTQVFSPQLMQGYLRASSQISRLAVGDRNASATSATYRIPHSRSQMAHVPGAPLGTRGGTSVVHVFPADGDYVIKVAMQYASLGGLFGRTPLMTMGFREQVDVSVNGERVATLDVSPTMTIWPTGPCSASSRGRRHWRCSKSWARRTITAAFPADAVSPTRAAAGDRRQLQHQESMLSQVPRARHWAQTHSLGPNHLQLVTNIRCAGSSVGVYQAHHRDQGVGPCPLREPPVACCSSSRSARAPCGLNIHFRILLPHRLLLRLRPSHLAGRSS